MTKVQINKEIRCLERMNNTIIEDKLKGKNCSHDLGCFIFNNSRIDFLKAAVKRDISLNEIIANRIINRTYRKSKKLQDIDELTKKVKKVRKIFSEFNNKKFDVFELDRKLLKVNFFYSPAQIIPALDYCSDIS